MEKVQDKRVFAGYYEQYDGKIIYVVMVVKDVETSEDIVIIQPLERNRYGRHVAMKKEDFCRIVTYRGKEVQRFRRRTQQPIDTFMEDRQKQMGLRGPIRNRTGERKAMEIRGYQKCSTYREYAKDIIDHYGEDLDKYFLCKKTKRYIGILPEEFPLMREDLKFLQDCVSTVLSEHKDLLNEKIRHGISIRKYAEMKGINRGSVEYQQRKLYDSFAEQLRKRDETEKRVRLRPE